MDPLIQTPAQEAAENAATIMADKILIDNSRVGLAIEVCIAKLQELGKPDLFQNRHYDWDDVLSLLAELAPTPNAEQAREFAIEWGNRT